MIASFALANGLRMECRGPSGLSQTGGIGGRSREDETGMTESSSGKRSVNEVNNDSPAGSSFGTASISIPSHWAGGDCGVGPPWSDLHRWISEVELETKLVSVDLHTKTENMEVQTWHSNSVPIVCCTIFVSRSRHFSTVINRSCFRGLQMADQAEGGILVGGRVGGRTQGGRAGAG